jgi:hypothetical protein
MLCQISTEIRLAAGWPRKGTETHQPKGASGSLAVTAPLDKAASLPAGPIGPRIDIARTANISRRHAARSPDLRHMLDLAKHIVTSKTAEFEPEKFEDHYEAALAELINAKRSGKTVGTKPRPKCENVVDLMGALKKSIAGEASAKGKKPRKPVAGQKEMLMSIEGKKPAKKAGEPERSVGRRKAG